MFAKVKSQAIMGINGYAVDVEIDVSNGLPSFEIVGLPDSAVRESKERVRSAINNSGFQFPMKRIIVNLAPANTKKEGPAFDLPIALSILKCVSVISSETKEDELFLGELSLDGAVKAVDGILPMIASAKKQGMRRCYVPEENAREAAVVQDIEVVGVSSLRELVDIINGKIPCKLTKVDMEDIFNTKSYCGLDFADVKGQQAVKRALEIAAAGMHNIILIGPPGSGKTMMAKRLPTILPDLNMEESLEITKIYSVAGLMRNSSALINERPFRSPHHTISGTAMIGGGRTPRPGEVSLSHNGVLFLDELPEFARSTLEELRQPLEDGEVTVSRVNGSVTFPAKLMLVASMNPCPCGYYGYSDKCRCTNTQINKYMGKVSGPLLDRIDVQVEATAVEYRDMQSTAPEESSEEIKKRVVRAQLIQTERYKNEGIYFNSQLTAAMTEKYCRLGKAEAELIKAAFERLNFSARAYHKLLKLARTIADLEGSEDIKVYHVAEALQLRNLDRKFLY